MWGSRGARCSRWRSSEKPGGARSCYGRWRYNIDVLAGGVSPRRVAPDRHARGDVVAASDDFHAVLDRRSCLFFAVLLVSELDLAHGERREAARGPQSHGAAPGYGAGACSRPRAVVSAVKSEKVTGGAGMSNWRPRARRCAPTAMGCCRRASTRIPSSSPSAGNMFLLPRTAGIQAHEVRHLKVAWRRCAAPMSCNRRSQDAYTLDPN